MRALHIVSLDHQAGKTALAAALGNTLQRQGKKVGYFKPVVLDSPSSPSKDKDVIFLKKALGLKGPLSALTPIVESEEAVSRALAGDDTGPRTNLLRAFDEVARDKDVVLAEGIGGLNGSKHRTDIAHAVTMALEASTIVMTRYRESIPTEIRDYLAKAPGEPTLGFVVNVVPSYRIHQVKEALTALIPQGRVKVLGMLPEDRTLLSITIQDLKNLLKGELVSDIEGTDRLVENYMVGCLTVDRGSLYFGLRDNKAVIVRGDRPDIQMPALETSVRCLVLTSSLRPIHYALEMAEERGASVIVTPLDTLAAMDALAAVPERAFIHHPAKVSRFEEMMKSHLDMPSLLAACGVRPQASVASASRSLPI